MVTALAVMTAVVVVPAEWASAAPSTPVTFADPGLESCVDDALGIAPGDPITEGDLASLPSLVCLGSVSDITPLQFATNLTFLDLGNKTISDIAPLAGLTQLTILYLQGNTIANIAPLAGLTALTDLDISNNAVTSVSALAGLTNLVNLAVTDNHVVSVSPLAGLTNLTVLDLHGNAVVDTAPLATLTSLYYLDVAVNAVTNPSPLAALTGLTDLYLESNAITDVSSLAALTSLTSVDLTGQAVSLAGATTCAPFTLPVIKDRDSSILPLTPSAGGTVTGDSVTWTTTDPATLTWASADGLFTGTLSQAVTACVLNPTPTPTISGTPTVGHTLTAAPGTWGPGTVTLGYQWTRNGADIAGATSSTYLLVDADAGTAIAVTVTGSQTGYATVSETSAAVNVAAPTRATTTTLGVSPVSGDAPQSVSFTATVTAATGSANGTVTFKDGTVTLGSLTVVGGVVAVFTTSSLAAGSHSLTAEFVGTAPYTDSTSAAVSATYTTPAVVFADISPDAPFRADILWLAAQGITTGSVQPDGSVIFDPAGPVRREAMAAFLYRFAGSPAFTPPATSPFVDVATTDTFYKAIAWLSAQGISTGTNMGDGTFQFRPAESVSREAMAAFLYRYKGSPAFTAPATSPFVDVATNASFYKEIAWLAANGISTGTDIGGGVKEFRPAESVRREAMAAFLHRTSLL